MHCNKVLSQVIKVSMSSLKVDIKNKVSRYLQDNPETQLQASHREMEKNPYLSQYPHVHEEVALSYSFYRSLPVAILLNWNLQEKFC